jgi:hypothetical protein
MLTKTDSVPDGKIAMRKTLKCWKRLNCCGGSSGKSAEVISVGVDVFDDLVWAGRIDLHLVWESAQTRCPDDAFVRYPVM